MYTNAMVSKEIKNKKPTMTGIFWKNFGALAGASPMEAPSAFTKYFFWNNICVTTLNNIAIPPAKNAHLKSPFEPVSPK